MSKEVLVKKIMEQSGLSKKEASDAIGNVLNGIEGVLSDGGQVTLTGFGKFSVTDIPARQGRNPRTGEPMDIKAYRKIGFKVGSKLKSSVNM